MRSFQTIFMHKRADLVWCLVRFSPCIFLGVDIGHSIMIWSFSILFIIRCSQTIIKSNLLIIQCIRQLDHVNSLLSWLLLSFINFNNINLKTTNHIWLIPHITYNDFQTFFLIGPTDVQFFSTNNINARIKRIKFLMPFNSEFKHYNPVVSIPFACLFIIFLLGPEYSMIVLANASFFIFANLVEIGFGRIKQILLEKAVRKV